MYYSLSFPQHGSRILLFWCATMLVYFVMIYGSLADIERIKVAIGLSEAL